MSGAAGMEVKETELLVTVPSEDEAVEWITAFIQLYRENARYLDRAWKWTARVGLDWVKSQVVDDLENRRALVDRFELSQSVYRKDPWAEHAKPGARDEFVPIADFRLEAAE